MTAATSTSAGPSSRILITGCGLHGAWGELAATRAALARGATALRPVALPGLAGLPEVIGAPAPEAVPTDLPDPKLLKYMAPATRLAVVAAQRALVQAGLAEAGPARAALGLYVATGLIAFDVAAVTRAIELARGPDSGLDLERMGRVGLKKCNPLLPFRMLLNMPLGLISIVLGLKGPNAILYPDVAQAGAALELALRTLRQARADRVLVVGTQQTLSLLPLGTLLRQARLAASVEAAQPFSPAHQGWAPADLAAAVVLEREEAAARRGAPPQAELVDVVCADLVGPEERVRCWSRVAATRPDSLTTVGSLTAAEDEAAITTARQLWGEAPPVGSWDGALGFAGPASLIQALVLAAAGEVAGRLQAPSGMHLIAAGDPDGGQAALLVRCS